VAAAVTVSVRLVAAALGRRLPCVRVRGSRTLEFVGGPVSHAVPVRVLWRADSTDPDLARLTGREEAEDEAEQLREYGYADVEIEEDN
jgi:hypothetical protein